MRGLEGYNQDNFTERALHHLEKDICYLARQHNVRGYTSEDLAQDLRLHLWRKLDKYDPSKFGLRTWAKTVMRRRIIDISDHYHDALNHDMREIWISEEWLYGEQDHDHQTVGQGSYA